MRKEHVVKLHLLKRLADGQFHSGETLGHELGISRAAISKHINALQDWGVDVLSNSRGRLSTGSADDAA